MPENSSFPDFMADWDRLIKVVRNRTDLPDYSGLLEPIEKLLEEGRGLEVAKAGAKSQLSLAAKRTRSLIPEGRAAASRLRAALKAHFGGHSEALVEFGVVPVRKRRAPQPADPPPVAVKVKPAVPSVSE